MNENAGRAWLAAYAPYVGPIPGTIYTKSVAITYPMVWDSAGVAAFEPYQTNTALLPSIFLVDQSGKIRLRYDIANDPATFNEHLNEIIATIDELLGSSP